MEDQEGVRAVHRAASHLAGNVSNTTGQNRKRNKPSAQLATPAKEVLDIMNAIKPKLPGNRAGQPRVQEEGVRRWRRRSRSRARSESKLSAQRTDGGGSA